jgi:hypothetical protein
MSASVSSRRLLGASAVLGAIGSIATALALYAEPSTAFQSYLFAAVFWAGLSVGSLAILMVHNLTGGDWGALVGAPLAAAARTLPLTAVFFIPLLFAMKELFPWTEPSSTLDPELIQAKSWYLNGPFFVARAAAYFAVWLVLTHLLTRRSASRNRSASARLSAGGLILYALTATLAAVDWIGSLMPQFYSTVFGMLVATGQMLAAMAFGIVCAYLLSGRPALASLAVPDRFHDLGGLQLMFVLAWTYLGLIQFVTVWVADLPHEIAWYIPRLQTSWKGVAVTLAALQFAIPFAFLLSRSAKRNPAVLASVASLLLLGHAVDTFWLVAPSLRENGFAFFWTDAAAFVGIGGLWLAAFLWQLENRPLAPSPPRTEEETDGDEPRHRSPSRAAT